MSKSNTKIPFKVSNNNENEIDVNVLLNDPKSLHKMLNKKSEDNDYVPTNVRQTKPKKGHQYELGSIKSRTERKQKRIAEENFEKLIAMRPVKKKEEVDHIPEFAPYAKKKYSKDDSRSPLEFFKEEGSKMRKNHGSKKEEKVSELIKKHMDKEKKENVKGNDEHPLLWNERIDAYLKNRLPEEKYDNLKNRWRKEENKPVGIGIDGLLEKEEKFKNEEAKAPAKALKNLIKNILYDKR